jgi:hypothetical protein
VSNSWGGEQCECQCFNDRQSAVPRTHFEVREDAEMLKKVALDLLASALASMVFPLPGGPNRSKPNKHEESCEIAKSLPS